MSRSLCWKITPKPEEPTYHSLYRSTWNLLMDVREISEDRYYDLELVLTHADIPQLKTILATANLNNNKEIVADMKELIKAIGKHESITLYVQ